MKVPLTTKEMEAVTNGKNEIQTLNSKWLVATTGKRI
jgi:hypothetical protein